jgi:hypothetical protein
VRVSAWARRAEPGGSAFLAVEWFGRHNERLRKRRSEPLGGKRLVWQRLQVSSRAPPGAAYASIELVVEGTAASPIWFDDVSFALR